MAVCRNLYIGPQPCGKVAGSRGCRGSGLKKVFMVRSERIYNRRTDAHDSLRPLGTHVTRYKHAGKHSGHVCCSEPRIQDSGQGSHMYVGCVRSRTKIFVASFLAGKAKKNESGPEVSVSSVSTGIFGQGDPHPFKNALFVPHPHRAVINSVF